jgi:hypothetical protein
VWKLRNLVVDLVVANTSGDTTLQMGHALGFVYDPISDRFVGWVGASAYTLNLMSLGPLKSFSAVPRRAGVAPT